MPNISTENLKYKIFGLTFESDISLNKFQKSNDSVDFVIEEMSSQVNFKDKSSSSLSFKIAEIHEKGFYCRITEGIKIEYKFKNSFNPNKKIAKIFHQPLAYLLFQRKFFVLHASAFSFKERSVALCGLSGSGKSESIKNILNDYKYISDDIVPINVEENNKCHSPGIPFICGKDGIEENYLDDRRERYLHWVPEKLLEKNSLNINRIYFLEWGEENKISEATEEEIFNRIIPNSFRPLPFGSEIEAENFYLTSIGKIMKKTNFYIYEREKEKLTESLSYLVKHLYDS